MAGAPKLSSTPPSVSQQLLRLAGSKRLQVTKNEGTKIKIIFSIFSHATVRYRGYSPDFAHCQFD
jgi:hypothetical protein